MKYLRSIILSAISSCSIICGCSKNNTNHIPAVENFKFQRYMGVWHEIARLPHSFERNIVDAQAEYTMLPDGRVRVVNRGERDGKLTSITGVARPSGIQSIGELEVSFFYPFYSKYKIIYLDQDYQTAIVTSDSMDYFWILSRKPQISREKLVDCLKKAQDWGFETKLLQYPNGLPQ